MRPDADWCSLCYAVLRAPAPAAVPEPAYAPAYEAQPRHAAPDPFTAPLLDVVLPFMPADPASLPAQPADVAAPVVPAEAGAVKPATWPCLSCGTANPLAAPVCSVCGSGFLAAASSTPKLVLPVVGDLGALSRGQRIGAALAVLALVLTPVAGITLLTSGGSADGGTQQPEVAKVSTP